jgi:hypothetical protein
MHFFLLMSFERDFFNTLDEIATLSSMHRL